MSGRYQVAFHEPDGRLAAVHTLTAADRLAYSRRLNGVGTFLLSLPRALRQPVMLRKDALAVVYRSDPRWGGLRVEGAYFLRLADHVPGEYEGLVVGGVSAEHLLARRIYHPDDDPLVAGGYSTKDGPAVTLMRQIVYEQLIAPASHPQRAVPGLSLGPVGADDTSPPYPFRREIGQQNVLEVLGDIARAARLDFWLDWDGIDPAGYPRFVFHAGRRGTDRSKAAHPAGPYVYLTPSSGNLVEPQLTFDSRDEATVVYVLGKGANGHRLVYRAERADALGASPYGVIERAVESSQADTLDELLAAAQTALAESREQVTFAFTPLVGAGGAVYGLDWELGDIVTVGAYGYEMSARITAVTVTLTAEGERIEVETERE
jgi:hypothetical protein